ncbi:uncharacterized protein BDR25DRAFT_310951 [Lindgomyces ingoldianus]|uniref:Uncharacterized protein n=1 Tax=Lindgomyces ingoldianus TaxID=673940 RepID=A0ACB6R8L2_9PLEO|nr:uncharacterized protein BDR25DRAFT_310951 [Lindgomyces ingoldianus]KAF2475604.1 hypothetical protein BDR25DRAFT_310951 [Lindgomyces ingoldianus]
MSHLLARQKSSGSLRRRKSPLVSVDLASVATSSVAPSSTTPSDQKPRDVKSASYQDPRYKTLLATKGSFMIKSNLNVNKGRFKQEAFTNEQLDKLAPFISNFISGDQSFFMATYYMYFPFLTFINGKDTKYYRHTIHEFSFIALDRKEKWTAYKFTKNVYDIWMPNHFKRLCSAMDQIPADLDFSVPQLSQSFGLSEDLQRHNLSGSSQPESQSQGNSQQCTGGGARDSTPNTSFTGHGAPKRPRKRLAEGQ